MVIVIAVALAETIIALLIAHSKTVSQKKQRNIRFLFPSLLALLGIILYVVGYGVLYNSNASYTSLLPPLKASPLVYIGPYIILAALYWAALMTKSKMINVMAVTLIVFTAFVLIYNNVWHV
jgi:hypothetical protein